MAFMVQPTKSKTGVYYLRRRIPQELRPFFPERGEFYRVSLKTKDGREAKIRFAAELARLDELFENARRQLSGESMPTLQDAMQLAARWATAELTCMESTGEFTSYLVDLGNGEYETVSGLLDSPSPKSRLQSREMSTTDRTRLDLTIAEELAKASLPMPLTGTTFHRYLQETFLAKHLELSELAHKRHQGNYSAGLALPPAAPLTVEQPRQRASSEALSKVFDEWSRQYLALNQHKRSAKKTVDGYQTTISRFIELFSDLPVQQIRRKTVGEFVEQLRRIPTRGSGTKGMNAREMIALADQENLPRLGNASVKNCLMALSATLSYALQLEYVSENVVIASGQTKALRKATAKQSRIGNRTHYTEAELIKIFSGPVFNEGWRPPRASFGEAWKWIPLLLCYTGARREEIAQMKANEVRRSEDGIWHLDILSLKEDGEEDDRTVKTLGSHRVVALHRDLIDLGLLRYVENLPAKGQLFPELKPNPTGWYGHNFGKRWGIYLRETALLDSPVAPAHGFRHTFITMCRSVGIPEEIRDAITGHDDGKVSRQYGERHLLKTQYEQLGPLPSTARLSELLT